MKNTRITKKPFPQFCQILKINCVIEAFEKAPRCEGYKICDSNDKFIGVVMLDPKYDGRAVIRFCNELKSTYTPIPIILILMSIVMKLIIQRMFL